MFAELLGIVNVRVVYDWNLINIIFIYLCKLIDKE